MEWLDRGKGRVVFDMKGYRQRIIRVRYRCIRRSDATIIQRGTKGGAFWAFITLLQSYLKLSYIT